MRRSATLIQRAGNTLIRILIVEDHPVVRAGLASMLGTQSGLNVVGSASCGEDALAALLREDVDVLLLDLLMPGMTGLEVLRAIQWNLGSPIQFPHHFLKGVEQQRRRSPIACVEKWGTQYFGKFDYQPSTTGQSGERFERQTQRQVNWILAPIILRTRTTASH
jgi:CheY-like chemotaxis protein